MSAASLASASTSGEGASARRAEGRASDSKADKEQVQGVRLGEHVRAQASKNLLQCRQCRGTSICEHNRRRRWCKEFIAHLRAQAENDHYSWLSFQLPVIALLPYTSTVTRYTLSGLSTIHT